MQNITKRPVFAGVL